MTFNEFKNSELSNQPHFLLFGKPVSHSVSPMMHTIAIKHHLLDVAYYAVEASESDISQIAAHLNKVTFLGANITIPFKRTFIELVDELSQTAREIGVINTIIKKNDSIVGENTDSYGFRKPLENLDSEINPDRAIIFGYGGATNAIIHSLNNLGFEEICIVSRNPNRLKERSNTITCSYDDWQYYAEQASLIINATPLGMTPNIDSSPVHDDEIELLADRLCYDIVYNPRETKFLKQAKSVNGITIGGLDMLIHQGDESFFRWTGKRFPIGLVKIKLDEYFSI